MPPPDELTAALRAHVARHNRHVLGFSLLTLLAAVILWLALYGVARWLTLFGLTIACGGDAALSAGFTRRFLLCAGALLFVAWANRRLDPERLPADKKSPLGIALDFLLAIPRATLAVWGNLSAWQSLTDSEFHLAAALVEDVAEAGRLPLQSAPLVITDDTARDKIIFALLLLHVLEIRRDDATQWLHLSPLRPEPLRALTDGLSPLPGIRHGARS